MPDMFEPPKTTPKIAVVGAGAMGSVYAGLFAEAGYDVTVVDIWAARISAPFLHLVSGWKAPAVTVWWLASVLCRLSQTPALVTFM